MILRRIELVLILFALWILAIVLPTVHFAPGNWALLRLDRMGGQVSPETEVFLHITGIILLLGVVMTGVLTIVSIWRGRRRKKEEEENFIYRENPPLPWSVYATLIFFLVGFGGLIWLASQRTDPLEHFIGPRRTTEIRGARSEHSAVSKPTESETERSEVVKGPSPRWIPFLMGGVAIVVGLLLWQIFRIKRSQGGLTFRHQVIQAVSDAIKELEGEGEVSDVVLRCYRDMCKILGRKVAMSRDLTAREFTRLLLQAGVREREVTGLTDLFERVRYGRGLSGPTEAAEALAFLKSIEEKYARSENET